VSKNSFAKKYIIMTQKLTRLFLIAIIAIALFSCKKSETTAEEHPTPISNKETIAKMVEITKQQTVKLKEKIAALSSANVRMTNAQYESFVRENIEEYSQALIEAEPYYVENNNLKLIKLTPKIGQANQTFIQVMLKVPCQLVC